MLSHVLNIHILGNLYFGDTGNCRIRKITVSTGIITTVAGTGTSSYSGDDGPATSATLRYPYDVKLDSSGIEYLTTNDDTHRMTCLLSTFLGNIYIADYGNHRIRKVTVSTGIITTLAGTGASSYSGDNGQATSAALYNPFGVALDTSGSFFPMQIVS